MDAAPKPTCRGMSMDVLIKGMKMPQSCYFCPLTNDGFYLCKANNPYKYLEDDCEERRPDWCPLVHIPPQRLFNPKITNGDIIRLKNNEKLALFLINITHLSPTWNYQDMLSWLNEEYITNKEITNEK